MVIVRRPTTRRGTLPLLLLFLLALGGALIAQQWKAVAPMITEVTVQLQGSSAEQQGASNDRQNVDGRLAATWLAEARLPKGKLTAAIQERCRGTLGTFCTDYYTQPEVPSLTAPRGSKLCSMDCNKVGTCNALSGQCTCPAGWTSFNCIFPMKRHCANLHVANGFERGKMEPNVSMGVGWESLFGFPRSHCAGFCDASTAACFCPSNTTYGRLPPPIEAAMDAPPVRQGRPMGQFCQPNKTPDGQATAWGTVTPDELFGPEGWCTAAQPKLQCECFQDGWGGATCEEPYEPFCLNQCNGRGECNLGYCKCDKGWHGIDCAHRSTSADAEKPGREVEEKPWIADFVHTPAAQDFAPNATRKRPLIFVYESMPDYNTLMIQYRLHAGGECVPRHFTTGNDSKLSDWTYMLETGFLEMLLQSEHRTLDPEEADFFYMPTFTSCFINPVRDGADSLRDFFYVVNHNRVQGAANLMLEAYHWIRGMFPYWDRRGGRDHIWVVTHDEASCWVPAALRPSIILSHWGRMDAPHVSGTGYSADVYSDDMGHAQFEPDGFLSKMNLSEPCYRPEKDLVVPLMKMPEHYRSSPLVGAPPRERTLLALHRGRVQFDNPPYSRGIRQRLAKAASEGKWLEKHKIAVGEYDAVEGEYSDLLASSVFCPVIPGDGWSARMDDAVLHGCIPVIIMDEVHVSFESIVDLSPFTMRIKEADAERLPDILQAVTQERREEMQRALAKVWQRFTYSSYLPYARHFRALQRLNAGTEADQGGGGAKPAQPAASLPEAVADVDPAADDAFGTIMAWLHSRIEATG